MLVVCATHDEIARVTDSIRDSLKASGEGRRVIRDVSLGWTNAQKSDWRNFCPGHVLCFHRAVKGIERTSAVTEIATMARGRALPANRTGGLLLKMDDQTESVSVALNAIQNQEVRAREKRLRMARGRCHRSPSLKHSLPNVSYPGLHQNCGRAKFRVAKSREAESKISHLAH